jgi:hypothetical protein
MSDRAELKVEIEAHDREIPSGGSFPVTVRLRNVGSDIAIVNKRLAMGYRDSLARELFADIEDASGDAVEVDRVDYDRDFSLATDYVELPPGAEVTTTIDLLEWYPIRKPGAYRVVIHYQADEPMASPPDGAVPGVFSGAPVDFTITGERTASDI